MNPPAFGLYVGPFGVSTKSGEDHARDGPVRLSPSTWPIRGTKLPGIKAQASLRTPPRP